MLGAAHIPLFTWNRGSSGESLFLDGFGVNSDPTPYWFLQ